MFSQVSVRSHLRGGGINPVPGPDGRGGTPSGVRMGGGGVPYPPERGVYPISVLDWGGEGSPILLMGGGVTPIQDQDGEPHPAGRGGEGTPYPILLMGVPYPRSGWKGVPLSAG